MSEEEEKRRIKAQQAKEVKSSKGSKDTQDVTIYDVSIDTWNRFVSLAKLYYDNEGHKVLEDALVALTEKYENEEPVSQKELDGIRKEIDVMKEAVAEAEGRIRVLEELSSNDEGKNTTGGKMSFGEARQKNKNKSDSLDEDEFEELKSMKEV